jgi:hypothetical protein
MVGIVSSAYSGIIAFVSDTTTVFERLFSGSLFQELLNADWVMTGSEEFLIESFASVMRVKSPMNTAAQPNPALSGLGNRTLRITEAEDSKAGSLRRMCW